MSVTECLAVAAHSVAYITTANDRQALYGHCIGMSLICVTEMLPSAAAGGLLTAIAAAKKGPGDKQYREGA